MAYQKLIKTGLLIISCGLFMGNEGCESDEAIKRGRVLKKGIQSIGITSSKVQVGQSLQIDVGGIINGKYLNALEKSGYFVSTNRLGAQSLSQQASLMSRKSNMRFRPLAVKDPSGQCTKNLPEAILMGNATEFELGNQFGVSIGFGPGGIIGGIVEGLDFTLKKMSMGINLDAYQPLTGVPVASSFKKGVKTDFGGGVKLNLGIISVNPSAMLRQPVAEVIDETLTGVLKNLGENLEQKEAWSARVFQENDSHILINAGSRHGLKKGDTLYISNMKYFWKGNPCETELVSQLNLQDRDNPIAKVIIDVEPSQDISIARVFEQRGIDIQEGARAFIYYLKGSKDENDPMPDAPNPEEVVSSGKKRVR